MIFKNFFSYLFKKVEIKTLFLVDILNMQDLNAIYGFSNGNYIIKQLNSILKNETKNSIKKILNREFHIKIKNLIYENIASNDFKLLDRNSLINIDITIGCSKSDDNRTKVYAEKALHNAKQDFLHYSYYDSFLYKNELINEDLVDTINYSIQNNLVEPYFQAIMDNNTNEIVKYEALMRIFDKDGNMIMPNVFIYKAKKCRLYNKLMEILFDKIIIYILKYKIHVSINLDYIDILNPQIKKTLLSKIKNNKIGSYLTLEILESEKVSNFELVNKFINETQQYGVKIAIDDFGTGFSNYENILNLDINYIKIDGSLIRKIDETIYLNLIKSIVSFSKEQNIKIVAEFVSDLKTLRYVKSVGIDYSQGYHIGKPMHINDIIKGNK